MANEKKKILLLSASAGAGHYRAAEALRVQAQESHPEVEVAHIDVMTLVPAGFRAVYTDFYLKLVERSPALWAYLYNMTDKMPRDALFSRLRRGVERLSTQKLHSAIRKFRPDHIVCTHFLPAELLAHEISKDRNIPPVWVQITDFDVHRMWVQTHMHGFFVASEEVAFRLSELGIPGAHIYVTGIPIMPAFSQRLDRRLCSAEIGIDPHKTTFLIMTGGAGLTGAAAMVERLIDLPGDFQIIALAGKNEPLLERYRKLSQKHPGRLWPQGFTTTIERLMACADAAITKPGGLTVSECLAMGLPMVLIAPIPGQEERNADYLMEHCVALKAYDTAGLEFRIKHLLNQPERLEEMRQRLATLGRPTAAQAVLQQVLSDHS